MVAHDVLGLQVGSTAPVFLVLLAVHVPAGLVAVGGGAAAALTRKGSRRHMAAGTAYTRALMVVAGTAIGLAALRWTSDAYLAVLGTGSLAAALFGRAAGRRRPGDVRHIV